MHVSLNRRSHRVGLSMQYLLWICFGLLAVVPWQVIRGQETPDQFSVEPLSVDWSQQPSPSKPSSRANGQRKRRPATNAVPELLSQPTHKSLIFRAQTAPPAPAAPGAMAAGPQADDQPSDMSFLGDDSITGRSGQAYGIQSQASVFTGPAIGRKTRILPIQAMPYVFIDNTLLFADVRGFTDLNNGFGMNLGGGIRQYLPRFDRILGFNGYYDYDNTSGALFREMGFGVESLGALYDIRANAYLPFGNTSQQLSIANINGTQKFVGHLLQVDQARSVANALHGFDSEIAVPLPGRAALRHDIRVAGGGYWFEGTDISSFGGWKARIQGNVIPSVQLNLQVSNDQQFKTNVVFGATWTFGGYRQGDDERKTQYNRMTTPVLRSYNMIVGLTTKVDKGVTVLDPNTGNPYFFEHVASYATGPTFDGTVEHPFVKVSDAQAVDHPGDIIFVHANSTYSGIGVVLQDNVRVLGEAAGIEHQVNTDAGLLDLPHPTQTAAGAPTGVRPIFDNAPTTGVVLANNSEFSGFQIGEFTNTASGAGGVGILGNGVHDVVVRQTDVSWSQGEGVFLNATSGTVTFKGDVINDPVTTATTFHVSNTIGNVIFTSDPLSDLVLPTGAPLATPGIINNVSNIGAGNGGQALLIENTLIGSNVNFTGSTANDSNGNGILVRSDAGLVTLGDANVINALGIGIEFLNDSGLMRGNGFYNVTNATGDSIVIQGLTSTGLVAFTNPATLGIGAPVNGTTAGITVSNRQARGIYLNDNAGNVLFTTPVSVSEQNATNLAAIEYQGSAGNVVFTNTSSVTINSNLNTDSGGRGILIGTAALDGLGNPIDNTGSFTVNAVTQINNTTGVGIEVTADKSVVSFNKLVTINDRSNIGIEIFDNGGPVSFTNTTTITTVPSTLANGTILPAVDIRRNTDLNAIVRFTSLNIEAANGGVNGPPAPFGGIGLNIGGLTVADANPASVAITSLNIGNAGVVTNGTGLFVNFEGQTATATPTGLTIGAGNISTSFGQAVDIRNSVMQTTLTSVSSSFSPTNGITLLNDQSFLPITTTSVQALNDFMFRVVGLPGAFPGSGGIITLATGDGINIQQSPVGAPAPNLIQTGGVSLQGMNINLNNNGIVANDLLHFQISNSLVNVNNANGISITDIPSVNISTSQFSLNGTTLADDAVHLTATRNLVINTPTGGAYRWNIFDNNPNTGIAGGFIGFVGAGPLVRVDSSQLLSVTTVNSTIPVITPLIFNFNNNSLTIPQGLPVNNNLALVQIGLDIEWIGLQSGNINQNNLVLTGFDRGIFIQNTDFTNLTNYNILGNTLTGSGGGNVGLDVNNFGPTDLFIASFTNTTGPLAGTLTPNQFNFVTPVAGAATANQDIAMRFSILNSTVTTSTTTQIRSFLTFDNNVISMTGAGSAVDQGIVFSLLQAPATVTFNNNTITVGAQGFAATPGEGIAFNNILGTIALQGTQNNVITVNGANTFPNAQGVTQQDWVLLPAQPPISRNGQFFVNFFTVQ